MRIVFDAYELVRGQGKSIGIYNYAKNLLHAMAENLPPPIEISVLCNGVNLADFTTGHPRIIPICVQSSAPSKTQRLIWHFGAAAWRIKSMNADWYFSPKGFCPFGVKLGSPKTRTAVVIHDLIPLWYAEHFPGHFGRLEELFINRSLTASAKYADKIIAISQATAADIEARTGRRRGLKVIYNGIPFRSPGPRPHPEPYLFAMASLLPHKNAQGVLAAYQAYRSLVDQPLPLMLCGVPDVRETGVTSITGVYDSDLHAYYAHTELFIFLSRAEGFGFPPVEALSHGARVLCSDLPVLREVTRNLAEYTPLDDANKIGAKIAEIIDKEDFHAQRVLRQKILEVYSWQACARQLFEFITE